MKKSTLKEVIKSEIKSLLSEGQMTTDEAFIILRDIHNKMSLPNPERDVRADYTRMEQALDTLQRAEVSKMMDNERTDFKDTGERAGFDMRGINESLNPEVTKALDRFIKAMAKKYGYEERDAIFAIQASLAQRKSDEKYGLNQDMPGFEGTKDSLDGIKSKFDQARRGGGDEESLKGLVGLREEDEMNDAEMDKAASKSAKKGDSIATTSNKLQKLVKKMKDKAKEFKAAEGDAKEKIKGELKDMTSEKKKLEKSL